MEICICDDEDGFVEDYNFSDKDNFGCIGIPSFTISEEIVENLHASEEIYKNIVAAIKTLSKDYTYWQTKASIGDEVNRTGYSYTCTNLHFTEDGKISFTQTCSNNSFFDYSSKQTVENMKARYIYGFLRQKKEYLYDCLFKMIDNQEKIVGVSATTDGQEQSKYLQDKIGEYSKHFSYRGKREYDGGNQL